MKGLMRVYRGLDEICRPFNRPVLTIGNFDGVHLGHQALFSRVVEIAGSVSGDAVAITFEPHPLKVLRPGVPLLKICSLEHKIELIARSGVGHLVILPFDKELAGTSAYDFAYNIFYRAIGVKDLVIGYDYALGKGRQGDIAFLRDASGKFGFMVHVVGPVVVDGMIVSSTLVRELVSQGDMRRVARLLGRYYQIRGIVQEGQRRGGPVLGFPTANLHLSEEDLCPKPGVYVTQVIADGRCHGGVLNIGSNPTFGGQRLGAEAHIFDFDKDIYGQPIKLNLIDRIRDEEKFSGPDELRARIAMDIETAYLILANEKNLKKSCLEGV